MDCIVSMELVSMEALCHKESHRASLVAQRLKHLPACGKPGFDPWVRKIPWRRKWQPTPVFLPGESHGWRSLVGYTVPRVAKSRTRLGDFTFTS